jgi:TonB-dependent receptor
LSQVKHTEAVFSRRFLALSTASSIALSAMIAAPAVAQDADVGDDEAAEEENAIVVTGFRAALESAQDIKRDADTFVDAITAEDIGALPDRSVAEALQRVPGVNIGRFEKPSDPDRFSVEGTGVIVRGLPFVRSELNGRDIFSATGGRVLSFNDVSPELLGRVEVFKNTTADMVDGGVAGTVNLVTRKPLDTNGLKVAGTIGTTYGDLREEWTPEFSGLLSNTWDTGAGTFGLQLGYAYSELKSRTDASQVTDPCYRLGTTGADGCLRALTVVDGGFDGTPNFNADNYPPDGALLIPKGAGVRTTTLDRERQAFSAVAQFESSDERLLITAEYLRADTEFFTDEYALLAQVNNDGETPEPAAGSTWTFDENGVFESGVLTLSNFGGYASLYGGLRQETLNFQRNTEADTEDLSLDIDFEANDRLRFNFEFQHIKSDKRLDAVIGAMNTWSDLFLDMSDEVPVVQFLAPGGSATGTRAGELAPDNYYDLNTYYWFLLDSAEQNDGELDSLRFDVEYDISDDGFFKKARFGARWSDRDRTTRDTAFSTWGNLSAPWAGRAGCPPWGGGPGCFAGDGPFVPDWSGFTPGRLYTGLPDQFFATGGGAFTDEFPQYSRQRNPFSDGFQRGGVQPIADGAAYFFGGSDDLLGEYLSGLSEQAAAEINAFSQTPNPFFGVNGRTAQVLGQTDPVACAPFCPAEINAVGEETKALYGRVDFGTDFPGGTVMEGNFGLRYIHTTVSTEGLLAFPSPDFIDQGTQGNQDGVLTLAELQAACGAPGQPGVVRGYCDLSEARQQEFVDAHTGEIIVDDRDIKFSHLLPSFNVKFDFGDGLLLRAAVSKGISRPDLTLFRAGGTIGDNTGDLSAGGTLASGPLFQLFTGNRNLRPLESWNYDLSLEWYFADVGSLTGNLFAKNISGIVNGGVDLVEYTSPSGVTSAVEVNGPDDNTSGTLKGFELTYQQTYDFLPGLLSGLGTQFTYTYVDGGEFGNSDVDGINGLFSALQPLAGISEHTINATIFYEKGPLAMRAAYNWRDDFLITARDDIWPYSPIWQESTGQLDASIFYDITDQIKVGVQGVNLLDEVTRTSQVVNFDGDRITRSAFRNDRRFTFAVRFDY